MFWEEDQPIQWKEFLDLQGLYTALGIGVVLAICVFVMKVDPLYIPPNDSNSAFPHPGHSTIPTVWCGVIVFVVALVVIAVFFFLSRKFPQIFRKFNPFSAAWSGVNIVLTTLVVTYIFKNYVGRARPDVYAVCGENANMEQCKQKIGKEAEDEWKSWPSGHSSVAMSGLSFVTFFGIKVVRSNQMWIVVLWSGFMMLALYIAATRIRDFRHHPDDVLAGLVFGFMFSHVLWSKFQKRVFMKEAKDCDGNETA